MEIKRETLEEARNLIGHALMTHIKGINEGWFRGGKDFKVSLAVAFEPGVGAGDFEIGVDISYTKDKVKDKFSRHFSQVQGDLFDGTEGTGKVVICPVRKLNIYASYCNGKCSDRLEIIMINGEDMPFAIPDEPSDILASAMIQHRSCSAWADDDTHEHVKKLLNWEPKKTNSCGMEMTDDGVCSHLATEFSTGTVVSMCDDPETKQGIKCCRECTRPSCGSRCSNSKSIEKKVDGTKSSYRIRNKKTGAWWEGLAESSADAVSIASKEMAGVFQYDDFEIRVQTERGGWAKPKDMKRKAA